MFGAGPAGIAAALRLLRAGHTVAILDRPGGDPPWVGETFSNAIAGPLGELGLWDRFRAAGHLRGHEIRSVWGDPIVRGQNALFDTRGAHWYADRARFDRDLREAAASRGCAPRSYARLDHVARDGDAWNVALDAGAQKLRARFLIDATGRRCALSRRLGARHRRFDRLVAIVAHAARNHHATYANAIVVEALPDGWWYASPLPGGHAIAHLTDRDLVPHGTANGAGLRIVAADSRLIEPGPHAHWLAAGDAYAAHDPLFGFGVTRALRNGIEAADAAQAFLAHHDPAPLRAYHAARRAEFDLYLDGLIAHYSRERRWSASPFWARRARTLAATA
ncbi:MAG TPA: FAD-dependent monooxygenase [Candidatus Limnocylindrales bacterium]|nr:FAD-dependent monooxygenase [Candidatus Limnocylindrales bacterium]